VKPFLGDALRLFRHFNRNRHVIAHDNLDSFDCFKFRIAGKAANGLRISYVRRFAPSKIKPDILMDVWHCVLASEAEAHSPFSC